MAPTTASSSTRVLAGVTIPDTPLLTEAEAYVRKHYTKILFNHAMRCLLFGAVIGPQMPPPIAGFDKEVQAIAAIFHDIGFASTGTLISKDRRFEVDGAEAARNFLRTAAPDWDEHKLQLVWDAIALHTSKSIAMHKQPEVVVMALGVYADLLGPDHVPGGALTWDAYNAITKEFPRGEFRECVKETMCDICRTKPETTYDNFVADFGEKFVEGYSAKGKQMVDMLDIMLP